MEAEAKEAEEEDGEREDGETACLAAALDGLAPGEIARVLRSGSHVSRAGRPHCNVFLSLCLVLLLMLLIGRVLVDQVVDAELEVGAVELVGQRRELTDTGD